MHAGVLLLIGIFVSNSVALPTRDQILELYHRAPQHIKDALARHGIHAHNLPSPASLANLHSSGGLISNHPGLANRLNLHALASRAQAILKRPPSQLPFPIPSFNKNSAQFQRRSGLVLPFAVKSEQQKESSQSAPSGPPPQIVTISPLIEGLQQNTHIKPVSSIINFGPVASSSSSSASDGIITGRPMREGQLPVKPQSSPSSPSSAVASSSSSSSVSSSSSSSASSSSPSFSLSSPSSSSLSSSSPSSSSLSSSPTFSSSSSSTSQNPRKPIRREEQVVSARSFSNPFDSQDDNLLSRPFSLPLNVRNPKYEYGGFVPISSSASSVSSSSSAIGSSSSGSSSSGSSSSGGSSSSNIISSPLASDKYSSKHPRYANGFMIDDEFQASPPAVYSHSRVSGTFPLSSTVKG